MPKRGEAYGGHILSVLCILVSLCLSGIAAWQPELGYGCALLLVITGVSEPSKYFCVRTLSLRRAGVWAKLVAFLWYVCCIATSIYLMHDLQHRMGAERDAVETAAISRSEAVTADQKKVEADIRAEETAIEDALRKMVPGLKSSEAYRESLLHDKLSKKEREETERERDKAELNDQLAAAIRRAEARKSEFAKKIVKTSPERSEPFNERSAFGSVRERSERSERLNELGYAAATLLELAIFLGIYTDGVRNRARALPAPTTVVIQPAPVPVQAGRTLNAERFEAWLTKEWKNRRDKDGWLRGSQQGWARTAGVSASTVHVQLDRLIKAKRIEIFVDRRETWIRFLKTGDLRAVP